MTWDLLAVFLATCVALQGEFPTIPSQWTALILRRECGKGRGAIQTDTV